MLVLRPNVYKSNFKWSLSDKKKIDTISFKVVNNSLLENAGASADVKITECTVEGSSSSVTLPLANHTNPTHRICMTNNRWLPFTTYEFAKSRVECVMASGEVTVRFDEAILGTPKAKLIFTGTSDVVDRGGSTYETYPTYENLLKDSYSLTSWIGNNKTRTNDSLTWDYENDTISLNAWVRKIIPAGIFDDESIPTSNDILTNWNTENARNGAFWDDWVTSSNFQLTGEKTTMWPTGNTGAAEQGYARAISIESKALTFGTTVTRINDFTFNVSWRAPVRVAYAAASRERGYLGTSYDIDNWAFVDKVASIGLEFSGTMYDEEVIEHSYSLDASGKLTTNTVGKSILQLPDSELLTQYTRTNMQLKQSVYDPDTVIQDAYVDSNGNINAAIGAVAVTGFILVTPGDVIESSWSMNAGYTAAGCMYDVFRRPIGAIRFSKSEYAPGCKFRVPLGCFYIRINLDYADWFSSKCYAYSYTTSNWLQYYPTEILRKYQKGKFSINCDVYASWAAKNGVKVGTQLQIKMPDASYVSKNNVPCTFEVKNITKIFKSNEFIYSLSLLEV